MKSRQVGTGKRTVIDEMTAKDSLRILALLVFSRLAVAQTACPEGVPIGDPRCGPSPSWHTSASVPQPRGPEWQLTWGAIAIDLTTGDVGAAVGHFSRGKAKREAMDRCAASGATKCQVKLAYKNQCAVVVWPSNLAPGVLAQSAQSIDMASQLALSVCAESSGSECSVVYSDCTVPVLLN
jgi:hypothetical protein